MQYIVIKWVSYSGFTFSFPRSFQNIAFDYVKKSLPFQYILSIGAFRLHQRNGLAFEADFAAVRSCIVDFPNLLLL